MITGICSLTGEKVESRFKAIVEDFPTALKRLEGIITKGLNEAGVALEEIRKRKLYKPSYSTFEEYCRGRWGESRAAMNFLIRGKQVRKENGNSNCQNLSDTALGQHIARLPDKKQRRKVIKEVTANGHSPTVKEVKKAVDDELGITRKIAVSKELKEELEKTGICPLCGHVREPLS